jgi:hypothetical protein
MAQAVEQHIPLDVDRWTLNKAFDYLTVTLGYPENRALHEMERERLAGRLVVQVHKVVDGKTQGDPEYLPPDKKHKFVRHLGWVVPQNHKWGDNRWTVYKQRVLELWPIHPPASQSGPRPLEDNTEAAGQSPQKPLTTKEWLKKEVERREKLDDIPEEITEFSEQVHSQMKGAAKAGAVKRVIEPRTIEQHLRVTTSLFVKKKRSSKS